MGLPRRTFLKTAALGAGSLLPTPGVSVGAGLPVPPVFRGGTLTVAPASLSVWPGWLTSVLAINGSVPGPTIRLRKGERFTAEIRNGLPAQNLVIHWHGLLAPAAVDGHPRQEVPPGHSYHVGFDIVQEPSLCWYHAHTHDLTAEQVYKGVAGLFLIDDPERDAKLGLPTGARDVPLVIRDWKSNGSFAFTYNPSMFEHMWGYTGDRILVNGVPDAVMEVDRGLWRFRLLNACNARVLRIGFADGRPFQIIANDGGLTGSIASVTAFDLAPGQRAEILVSFADASPGATFTLRSLAFARLPAGGGGPAGPRQGDPLDVMSFRVTAGNDGTATPTSLPAPRLPNPAHSIRTRSFQLGMTNQQHTINQRTYELDRIDFTVPSGAVEIWEFVNQTANLHPMHIHGTFFCVVSRHLGGVLQQPLPTDSGLRDTVLVYPNETVRVALCFGPRHGEFLMHCHNLEHEHQMMLNFVVTDGGTPTLEILEVEGKRLCRWPLSAAGWQLETSADLLNWSPVSGDPVVRGVYLEWTEPEDARLTRFFRLATV